MEHGEILRSLRATGGYSDLTVICGDQEFKVHKNVMCLRSNWFATACREGRWQEGRDGVIHLEAIDNTKEDEDYSCDDPEAVRLMIDYIYLNDYTFAEGTTSDVAEGLPQPFTPNAKNTMSPSYANWSHPNNFTSNKKPKKGGFNTPNGALTMHARLYGMASKYGVDTLRSVAIRKFQEAVSGTWDRGDFAAAVTAAFNTTEATDLGLRNVIIEALVNSSTALATDPIIEKAVNAIEGLPFELFKQLSLKQDGSNQYDRRRY